MNSGTPRRRPDWATLPNAITVLRLALVVPISVLIIEDRDPVLALALLVAFGASDWVDGALARALHQTSRLGAMMDPIADRIGVAVIVFAFVLRGDLSPWIIISIAAVDVGLTVVYFATRSKAHPPVSIIGKIRTAILMIGIAFLGLGLLPGWEWSSTLGQILCTVGVACHVLAGAGYLRTLLRGERAANGR